ncbi:methyl-accepting chemotaxis protein [Bradyrhizobium sp. i1.4.4]
MSNRATAKFLPQFKLGTKAVLCAVLLIAVNTALVVGAGYWSLTSAFNDRALRDIEVNLRTLALAFAEVVPDAKITMRDGGVARAEIPKMPEFRDHAIVDRAVSYVGGNATLFVFDDASGQFVRRSTNVKKENGDRAVGTQLAADHPGQAVLRRGEAYRGPATLFGKTFMTAYFPVADATGKVVGILYVGIPMAQFESMLTQAIESMAIAAGIAALLVLVLTLLVVRRITRPLTSVTRSLTALAEGKSDVEIDCEDRADEIGEIARTVAVFKSNSLERARLRSEQTAVTAAAAEQRKAELRNFVEQFRGSVGGILDKVLNSSGEFERVARQLTDTARSTADLSAQSAGASENASEHVRTAASASDELSQSISEITRRVQESNEISAEAVRQAEATDQRMAQLSEAGARIGDVVKLITSIAEQTNLLALNATIEAARAPGTPVAASRWWPRRSRRSPARPPRRRTRSRTRSPACSLQRRNRSPPSRRSARPSSASAASRARSRPRSSSRGAPPTTSQPAFALRPPVLPMSRSMSVTPPRARARRERRRAGCSPLPRRCQARACI